MSDKTQIQTGGTISFCGLLTIAFIVLKLLDKITWSWIWVLAPLWIPFALLLVICLVGLILWKI